MSGSENIWDAINFSQTGTKVLDYLDAQKDNLSRSTSGVLKMNVDTITSYLEGRTVELLQLYVVYIVAEKLGNFRVKLFTVIQKNSGPEFPVDIYVDSIEKKIDRIEEEHFLDKLNEILSDKSVQTIVLNLYKQSIKQ